MGMVNEMISSIQGGAPPLSTRCYTSFWAWTRAFPYPPSPQSGAEESGGVRLPPFFWLDWQHFRGASRVRCLPQFVPSTGGGFFFTVPPRLGRPATWCMCPRACGHLSANAALIVPPRQPHAAEWHPPGEDPSGTHSGRRACVVLGTASEPRICIRPSRSRGPEPNPPVAPGRVAPSARQI